MLAQKFGIALPEPAEGDGGDDARRDSALREGAAQGARDRGGVFPRAAGGAGRRAGAAAAGRARRHAADDRAARPRLRAQSRDGLKQRLLKQGFAQGVLLQSGLLVQRDSGEVVDRFRNRLMMPICRDTGSVIAFGGRQMDADQGGPKYLNSPETPIYSKGRTLYGLNLTKAADPEARLRGAGRGLFRLRAGVSVAGGPGGRLLRHGADAAAGAAAAALHVEGRAELRPRRRRPGRGGPVVRTAGRRRVRRQRRGAGQGRRSRYVHPAQGRRSVPGKAAQRRGRIWNTCSIRRPRGSTSNHDDNRRQFLGKMLTVAARIPDAAARDQFADRIAHKAQDYGRGGAGGNP